MVPAPPLTVTVDGAPLALSAPALVVHGRVLLPARATFDALAAEVRYDAAGRTVFVRRGSRDVVITVGSNAARIDGAPVDLGTPARIVYGRTYVPLRFIAEALGGQVTYDAGARTVAVTAPRVETARSARPPTVEDRRPAPGETVGGPYPSISAAIQSHGGPVVDGGSIRLFLDGRDVTDQLAREGDLVGFTPGQPVGPGAHEVTLQGADADGARFTSNWTFYSTFAYANVPTPYNYGGFYLNGPVVYSLSPFAQVVLIAPAGGYGYANLCGYAQQFPLLYAAGAGRYMATIPIPANLYAPGCLVSGYFVDATGGRNFLALGQPLTINTMPLAFSRALTATPRPTARRSPHPFVRTLATPRPSPRPTRRPAPKPTSSPAG